LLASGAARQRDLRAERLDAAAVLGGRAECGRRVRKRRAGSRRERGELGCAGGKERNAENRGPQLQESRTRHLCSSRDRASRTSCAIFVRSMPRRSPASAVSHADAASGYRCCLKRRSPRCSWTTELSWSLAAASESGASASSSRPCWKYAQPSES